MPNSRHTMTITREALIAAAQTSKAWPFQEAQRLAKRLPQGKPGGVLFETGYINNPADLSRLRSEAGRLALAQTLARAIRVFFARSGQTAITP